MSQKRLVPEERKAIIVSAALKLSNDHGLSSWTRQDVAEACSIPTSAETVKHYFAVQEDLRKAVLADPACTERLKIQGQALGLTQ